MILNQEIVRLGTEEMDSIPGIIAIVMMISFGIFTSLYYKFKNRKNKLQSSLQNQTNKFPLNQ